MNRFAYIFLDESGNFDFSASGSRYFLLTSVSLRRPFPVTRLIDAYRHECLEFGLDLESFHCANDNRYVRGRVFDLVAANLDEIRIDFLAVEKRRAEPSLRQGSSLYPKMLGYLLKFVIRKEIERGERVHSHHRYSAVHRQATRGGGRSGRTLARMLPVGTRLRTFHYASCSHYGLQLADYCCWAMFRK